MALTVSLNLVKVLLTSITVLFNHLSFRTRPVISLNSVVKVSPNEISLTNKTCGDRVW